jgi:hypothetical protein
MARTILGNIGRRVEPEQTSLNFPPHEVYQEGSLFYQPPVSETSSYTKIPMSTIGERQSRRAAGPITNKSYLDSIEPAFNAARDAAVAQREAKAAEHAARLKNYGKWGNGGNGAYLDSIEPQFNAARDAIVRQREDKALLQSQAKGISQEAKKLIDANMRGSVDMERKIEANRGRNVERLNPYRQAAMERRNAAINDTYASNARMSAGDRQWVQETLQKKAAANPFAHGRMNNKVVKELGGKPRPKGKFGAIAMGAMVLGGVGLMSSLASRGRDNRENFRY